MKKRAAEVLAVSVRVKCTAGHETALEDEAFSLHSTGGCGGHGPDEYCYCEPPEIEVEFVCPQCPQVRPAQTAKVRS